MNVKEKSTDLKFPGFTLYNKKPNTITDGTLYTKEVTLSFSPEQKRTLRVFIPKQYDGVKRFPVLYFADGQNIVDHFTSPYGSWEVDEINGEFAKEGNTPFILVGLDCPQTYPQYRFAEYCPHLGRRSFKTKRGASNNEIQIRVYAEKTAEFFTKTIKPLIDKTFLTMPDKEHTGICGSSMGGLFSFYTMNAYSDVYGLCLCYSPAFLLFAKQALREYVASIPVNKNKVYIFASHGDPLEKSIGDNTKWFVNRLKEKGYDESHLVSLITDNEIHHESAWHRHLLDTFHFFIKDS